LSINIHKSSLIIADVLVSIIFITLNHHGACAMSHHVHVGDISTSLAFHIVLFYHWG